MKTQPNSMRVCYMVLFFANAVFACVFRSIGDGEPQEKANGYIHELIRLAVNSVG